MEQVKVLDFPGVRTALATNLFKQRELSLARSAKLADMPLEDFVTHLSRLGIAVIEQTAEEVERDMDTLEQWLAS